MILINLKTYPEAQGDALHKMLLDINRLVSERPQLKEKLLIAPPTIFLAEVVHSYRDIKFVAQHVDNHDAGQSTGWVVPENLLSLGVEYAMLNHSEHRVPPGELNKQVIPIQAAGLKVISFCESVEEAELLINSKPFAIVYEPKDLIGSGISVTTRPEIVQEFVQTLKGEVPAWVGAGISTKDDVSKSLELGASGVGVASAFVRADDQYAKLKEFVEPFFNLKI